MTAPQTRAASAREAVTNTATAFVLSLLAHRYVVAPLTGEYIAAGGDITDWTVAALTTIFYTLLSLGRNYIIRRLHV